MFDKVVIVTRETQLEQLVRQFSTKGQAKFYIEQSQRSFREKAQRERGSVADTQSPAAVSLPFRSIEEADTLYKQSLRYVQGVIPPEIKVQHIDWTFLPNFLFGEHDLVVAIGQDGLVVNIAKYLTDQPIVAVNPDPSRFDGVLLPFTAHTAGTRMRDILRGEFNTAPISIAQASLDDGQVLLGVNDIFIGPRSHISFRCSIEFRGEEEQQSSSGIIVSTGCGSTGWFKSIIEGARRISSGYDELGPAEKSSRFSWDSDYLYFTVREPFGSRVSGTGITFGKITGDDPLTITSHMADRGVIFSDGMEQDFLEFNSGRIATISLAERKARLVTG